MLDVHTQYSTDFKIKYEDSIDVELVDNMLDFNIAPL